MKFLPQIGEVVEWNGANHLVVDIKLYETMEDMGYNRDYLLVRVGHSNEDEVSGMMVEVSGETVLRQRVFYPDPNTEFFKKTNFPPYKIETKTLLRITFELYFQKYIGNCGSYGIRILSLRENLKDILLAIKIV